MSPQDEPIAAAELDAFERGDFGPYPLVQQARLARALRAERETNRLMREGARSSQEQNSALVAENRRLHALLPREARGIRSSDFT